MDRVKRDGWVLVFVVLAMGCGASAAPPAMCESDGCGDGEACLRGVCIATCGADVAAIDAALAEGLVPAQHVCRVVSGPIAVVTTNGAPRVYDVASATTGTTTTFTLSRWTLEPAMNTPSIETVATTSHEGHDASSLYAGGYLALSPDESRAIFGYTTSDEGYVGGVFDVEVGDGTASEVGANGNYEGAWLDGTHFVINGLGMQGATGEGQGLYVRDVAASRAWRALDEMGDYSGSVAVIGDVVVAGALPGVGHSWPDGGRAGRIFVLDRDTLLHSESPLSAWEDSLARLDGPTAFTAIGGSRLASVVYSEAPPFDVSAIEVRSLEEGASGWTLSAPVALTTGNLFQRVAPVGEGRMLLVHSSGVLIVHE